MRILHVTFMFPPIVNVADGITNVVYHVTRELAKRGHEVSVYTSNASNLSSNRKIREKELIVNSKLHVQYLNYTFRFGPFFFTPSIIRLLRDTIDEFDIIHMHDTRSFQGIAASLLAGRHKVPYVFQPHGTFLSPLPTSIKRMLPRILFDKVVTEKIVKRASRVLALTKNEVERFEAIGIPESKITMLPNGVDLKEFRVLPSEGTFKAKHGIKESEKIILYLGRIHEIKGLDFLVRAYADLIKNENGNGSRLVIVGPDDGFLHELRTLIKTLRIEQNVMILGPLYGRDKLEAYVDANVYVLPSRYDTFPMALLEAYACGKTVIASRVEGLKDLVSNNVTGLLVEPGDIAKLSSSISRLLGNVDETAKMGLKAKQLVEESFSLDKVTDRLEEIYKETTSS